MFLILRNEGMSEFKLLRKLFMKQLFFWSKYRKLDIRTIPLIKKRTNLSKFLIFSILSLVFFSFLIWTFFYLAPPIMVGLEGCWAMPIPAVVFIIINIIVSL